MVIIPSDTPSPQDGAKDFAADLLASFGCPVCVCLGLARVCFPVLVCLPVCGHGRGNGAPCAGRAICASFAPLGVYIYAVGSESCTTRRPLHRSAPLGPTKLRFCSQTLFLWAFRSAFGLAPQNATRFSAVKRRRSKPRLAPLVEFVAWRVPSASLPFHAVVLPRLSLAIRVVMPCRRDTGSLPHSRLSAQSANRIPACHSALRSATLPASSLHVKPLQAAATATN